MGSEYWILKSPKFISHTENQRLKKSIIEVRLFEIQYLKRKTHTQKFRNLYEVQFKNRDSLCFFFARL